MKNRLGLDMHKTDEWLHWRDQGKKGVEKAERLRSAYDAIIDAGLEDQFDILADAIRDRGFDDGYDVGYSNGNIRD